MQGKKIKIKTIRNQLTDEERKKVLKKQGKVVMVSGECWFIDLQKESIEDGNK